jgi:hypothetical protein
MRDTLTTCVNLNTLHSLTAHNSLFDGFVAKFFTSRAVVLGFLAQPLFSMSKQFRLQTQVIAVFGCQRSFSRSRASHLGGECTAGAGDVHTIPLDLRVPIPLCTICFPRETHLRDFPNEETNDTVLQLFVEPKGAPPRFELLRLANKRALSLPCNPPPGHLRKLRLSGIP